MLYRVQCSAARVFTQYYVLDAFPRQHVQIDLVPLSALHFVQKRLLGVRMARSPVLPEGTGRRPHLLRRQGCQ